MRCEGKRAQHRARADVGGRFLAPDMLLPGREGQYEAALSFRIDGLAGEPARHLADMLLAAGEQADVRSSELETHSNTLSLADDDIRSHFARRPYESEGNRFGDHGDEKRSGSMGRLG